MNAPAHNSTSGSYVASLLGTIRSHLEGLQGYDVMALELIQNADDAKADEISFDITEQGLWVTSFPPAALPAFTGTTRLSDSLHPICLPPSSVVRHTLISERGAGSPRLPHNPSVKHAMVSDPGEADISLPLASMSVLASTFCTVLSFPT